MGGRATPKARMTARNALGNVDQPVLVVPGWTGSGPDHWQSRWQRANPEWRRVEQADWDNPRPASWTAALAGAIDDAPAPPVLVAHSLGALTVARWAAEGGSARVAAAFLVVPPDVERPDTPPELKAFAPLPSERLPFPSVLVASRTDPFMSWERALVLAANWSARVRDAGAAGHLNTAAGFGPWPEGERWLAELVAVSAAP
jgi:uncharacterized protein